MMKFFKTSILFISVFITISCTKHDDSDQRENEIRLEYKTFHPFQLTVTEGTTVTFVNKGGGNHTLNGNLFNSGKIEPDETYAYTFDTKGNYSFSCFIHSNAQEQVNIIVE